MAANGRGGMRPTGRSPPFLLIGLTVALFIVGFNYWNVSSRNNVLSIEMGTLKDQIRSQNAIRLTAEKRSEEVASKIRDCEEAKSQMKTLFDDKDMSIHKKEKELDEKKSEIEALRSSVSRCESNKVACDNDKLGITEENQKLKVEITELKSKNSAAKPNCDSACKDQVENIVNILTNSIGKDAIKNALSQNGVHVEGLTEQLANQASNNQKPNLNEQGLNKPSYQDLNQPYNPGSMHQSNQGSVQQPNQGSMQQPNQGLNQQENQGLNQQENQGLNQQENQGLNQQENQGLNQQENQGLNQQRKDDLNQNLNQQPNQGLNQQPNQGLNQGLNQQPNQGLNQQPNQGLNAQPNQGLNQQPNQGINQQPNQGINQQPIPNVNEQPNQGLNQQPNQGTNQQPNSGLNQPNQVLNQQPSIGLQEQRNQLSNKELKPDLNQGQSQPENMALTQQDSSHKVTLGLNRQIDMSPPRSLNLDHHQNLSAQAITGSVKSGGQIIEEHNILPSQSQSGPHKVEDSPIASVRQEGEVAKETAKDKPANPDQHLNANDALGDRNKLAESQNINDEREGLDETGDKRMNSINNLANGGRLGQNSNIHNNPASFHSSNSPNHINNLPNIPAPNQLQDRSNTGNNEVEIETMDKGRANFNVKHSMERVGMKPRMEIEGPLDEALEKQRNHQFKEKKNEDKDYNYVGDGIEDDYKLENKQNHDLMFRPHQKEDSIDQLKHNIEDKEPIQ